MKLIWLVLEHSEAGEVHTGGPVAEKFNSTSRPVEWRPDDYPSLPVGSRPTKKNGRSVKNKAKSGIFGCAHKYVLVDSRN
ncbi:hypothetical protein L484_019930 [Morus notabilis]|uniref:Uncharacterized protein n=1 Tax=Morus notabilis TaxID=981085 RepID=W9R2U5_9ROSA|nr:hypothetical protein L484_019930 [Morus notabilis]